MANQLKFMDDASPERRELLGAKLEAYGTIFLRAIGEWEGRA